MSQTIRPVFYISYIKLFEYMERRAVKVKTQLGYSATTLSQTVTMNICFVVYLIYAMSFVSISYEILFNLFSVIFNLTLHATNRYVFVQP